MREIFGKELMCIHHTGSTSIKGLNAKPIIDMVSTVKNIEEIDKYKLKMLQLGDERKGEKGIIGRRYFVKRGDYRIHPIHIYENDNPHITNHIAFRDYIWKKQDGAENYGN